MKELFNTVHPFQRQRFGLIALLHAGGGKKDSNILFVRSVPKFLQGHMHLLGRKPPQEEEEAQLASMDEENGAASDEDEKVVKPQESREVLHRLLSNQDDLLVGFELH